MFVLELHVFVFARSNIQTKYKFSGITFIMYAQNQKIGYPNNLSLWEQGNQKPKQDSQYRLRSHMPEGEELYFQ